jgi:hypothetical protein
MPPSPHELLEFLIATLARKPPSVPFRTGASVARYLDDLAYGHAGEERKALLLLSKVIWRQVFQFGKFRTAAKHQTIQFLEAFARTHLAEYDVTAALRMVADHPAPGKHETPRVLRSPNLGRSLGSGSPRLSSDLTERIYVAYWALRLTRIHGASGLIAKALNRYQVPTGSRQGDGTWSPYEIQSRVKQFEKSLKEGRNRKSRREALIAHWEGLYYPIKAPR